MDAAIALQSRLIGTILVQKNLIDADQLEQALQIQEDSGERLGEIVVAEFGVSRLELASVLAEQWAELESAERESAAAEPQPLRPAAVPLTPAEVPIRRPIGEIFVELGFINTDQLDSALDTQRETGARIGEILVEQGSLSRLDLASALAEQWSALQKLRPPAPVADPQPWQNGSPLAVPPTQEAVEDRETVAALAERLRLVESAASEAPWQEDIRRVGVELRTALAEVVARVEAGAAGAETAQFAPALTSLEHRLDAFENAGFAVELEALRQSIADLSALPQAVDGLADVQAALARLESRPDRDHELESLTTEIAVLAARLDGLESGTLAQKLDAVAGQAEVAQTGIAALSRRIDDLDRLGGTVDELAARVPAAEVVEELRRALEDLRTSAERDDRNDPGAEIPSLVARLDQVSARVEDVANRPDSARELEPRLDAVAARVEEISGSLPAFDADGLAARLELLESARQDESELEQLRERTERLAAVVDSAPDSASVSELRERLDELGAVVEQAPAPGSFGELQRTIDGLAAAVARGVDEAALAELRRRVDELAALAEAPGPQPEALDSLSARLDELTTVVEHVPARSSIEELQERLESLAGNRGARPGRRPPRRAPAPRGRARRSGGRAGAGARAGRRLRAPGRPRDLGRGEFQHGEPRRAPRDARPARGSSGNGVGDGRGAGRRAAGTSRRPHCWPRARHDCLEARDTPPRVRATPGRGDAGGRPAVRVATRRREHDCRARDARPGAARPHRRGLRHGSEPGRADGRGRAPGRARGATRFRSGCRESARRARGSTPERLRAGRDARRSARLA